MSGAAPPGDQATADGFAASWNTVGIGSVYTAEQFRDWMAPLDAAGFAGRDVLELGFGNGSLLYHMARCSPSRLVGVELGDTLEQTRRNLAPVAAATTIELHRGDLLAVDLGSFDLVYSIGVLHHLADPDAGLEAVLRHTCPGGHFHCWVYAREGNWIVRTLVEPLRRISCRLPWWLTKYLLAMPLVTPFFLYAKSIARLSRREPLPRPLRAALPLHDYSLWIAQRPFGFFHHVAFDQLVTPQTTYLPRHRVEQWLRHPLVDPASTYLVFRNANSWKFGGRRLDGRH